MFRDKNILIISHSYQSFVKDQIEVISKQFNHVYVLVRYNPLFELMNYIPLVYLKNILESYTISNKIDLSNKPENVTIILTPLKYLPIDSFYNNLGSIHFNSVYNILNKHDIKFDIIHSHFIWTSGYVGIKLKQKYNVPLVITGHGYDVYQLPFKNYNMKTQIINIMNNSDHIITVSNKNYNIIKKLNIKTPISVISNGFNNKLFNNISIKLSKKQLNIPLNIKIILSVGNLISIKGHIYLIQAMNKIIKKRKDVQCIIIGNGDLKNNLQKQIDDFDLTSYIKLVGTKPHNEIPLWMNASDLFVLPSLNEGNPTVMFESLACGCPFIGSNVGGISEVITSNDYGALTNPADSIDLEEKILWGLEKEWNREKITNYAQKYTWNNLSKQILDVYDIVLTKNGIETHSNSNHL